MSAPGNAKVKVRFAPSPTGYLHVGNTRIALANALFARSQSGVFLLRIDDTDQERSKPEYEAAIEQDLKWLGIGWDESFRQSDRAAAYEEAAERLKASGRLYPCFESEEELKFKRDMRLKRGQPPVYDRAMLKMTAEQRAQAEAGGKTPYWRFRLSNESVTWDDGVLGHRIVKLPSVSDPVLIRADGTPLYTFTSVVDDLFAGVTHIIRGEDHVTNTGIQIDLMRALGGRAEAFGFAHLPLLVDSGGGKLSKRLEGLSLRSLRLDGMEPLAIVAYLARLGSSLSPEVMPIEALAENFDMTKFSRSPARFDMAQLLRLNRHVLHEARFEDVRARLPEGATAAFWEVVRGNLDLLTEARHWWDVVAGEISPPAIEGEGEFLQEALALLPDEPWDAQSFTVWTRRLKESTGRGGKKLFMPLRLALTGEVHGPELAPLMPLMGRSRVAHRLAVASL
jgi:glutamyl-tRNA synthetase